MNIALVFRKVKVYERGVGERKVYECGKVI
jgi:hypothetical protein